MSKHIKKKICIVTVSLGGGGAERSAALLSIMLAQLGYEVHVVTAINDISYAFSGQLLNLGLIKEKHSKFVGSIKRFSKLYNYIRVNDFDYIIDSRTRMNRLQEFFVSKLLYKPARTIYCVRSFNIYNYLPSNHFLAKWFYGNAHKIVGVSNAISQKLRENYQFRNVVTINNPINLGREEHIINQDQNLNYVLFFGRLIDDVKNISLLLEAYGESKLPNQKIKLIIMGDGKDKNTLREKARVMSCSDYIEFLDFNPKPEALITQAKFTILTSHYEGFPRMILESLALGTPVISVDCESGPSEIIDNGLNGLLVRNHNPKALADAMDKLSFNTELYDTCKVNAKASVAKYSQDNIAREWQKILK